MAIIILMLNILYPEANFILNKFNKMLTFITLKQFVVNILSPEANFILNQLIKILTLIN